MLITPLQRSLLPFAKSSIISEQSEPDEPAAQDLDLSSLVEVREEVGFSKSIDNFISRKLLNDVFPELKTKN